MKALIVCLAATLAGMSACSGDAGPPVANVPESASKTTVQEGTETTTGEASSQTGAAPSPGDARLAFARCMRANGITHFTDPVIGPDGFPVSGGIDVDDPQALMPRFNRVSEMCAERVGPIEPRFTEAQRAAWVDAAFEYAKCMREKGFDMPDPRPTPESGMGYTLDTGLPGETDPHTVPSFARADRVCGLLLSSEELGFGPEG